MTLENELRNDEHWERTFDKMTLKQSLTKEDRDELWRIKTICKDDIISNIVNGTYRWSMPRKAEIAKHDSTKKRVVYIYSLKDRYVQGVMYRAISAFYQDSMSNNCFSYKRAVSTSHAIQYIKENRSDELKYGVKTDIHAYFNSVNKETVAKMINELFDGGIKTTIENLMFYDIVIYQGWEKDEWKSLMPGSPLGSFFANWCLKELDDIFESQGKTYARYSDDIVVLEDSKEKLYEDIEIIKDFIGKCGLTLNPDKFQWFKPGEAVDFLGLKLYDNGVIDISDHSKQKIKKQIHRWCRKGRMEIERDNADFYTVAKRIVKQLNNKNFKCFINNDTTFGWCAYAFPRITTVATLRELDLYTKQRLMSMKTGKNNKANYKKMTEDEFHDIGWVSLVQLYNLYRQDFDYYCEIIELL